MNTIDPPGDVRDVVHPPAMMQANISIAPFAGIHLTGDTLKIREVVPIVTVAGNKAGVTPVVIAKTIGGKMDVAKVGLPGILFVVTCITFPKIGIATCLGKGLFHD